MVDAITQQIQLSLTELLTGLPAPQAEPGTPLIVAYSGGVDSTVLLHALSSLPEPYYHTPIHAVHIHHGLSRHADEWQAHCKAQAELLGCTFHTCNIQVISQRRKSIEATARNGRYRVLLDYAQQVGGILVLGQHQDDQLETFWLQAKRGAGPKGLGSMQAISWREGVAIVRPMLQLSRLDLEQIAAQRDMAFVTDESNSDTRFDRNYIRNEITPLLKQRWPQIATTVSRSAALCAEQTALLEEVLDSRLSQLVDNDHALDCTGLMNFSIAWQKHLIRRWLETGNADMPSAAQMAELLAMPTLRQDAQPVLVLGEHSVRLHNNWLKLVRDLPRPPVEGTLVPADIQTQLPWWETAFRVSSPVVAVGHMPSIRIRLQHTPFSKKLKDWFKMWKVPVWERANVPVLMLADKPVAIILKDEVIYLADRPADLQITVQE